MLRGYIWKSAIGVALRKYCCFYQYEPTKPCDCDLKDTCLAFHWHPAKDHETQRKEDTPKPYVMKFPSHGKVINAPGEIFEIDILLLGRVCAEDNKLINAMQGLGRDGIGKGRGRFRIVKVIDGDSLSCEVIFKKRCSGRENFLIEMVSPHTIKNKNKVVKEGLTFHVFFESLLNRIINLNRLHGHGDRPDKGSVDLEKKTLIQRAESVKYAAFTEWREPPDYLLENSKNKEKKGLVGILKCEGDMKLFYPYLKLGEYLGVGNSTTQGYGSYRFYKLVAA